MLDTFDAMRAGIALALAVYAGAGIVGGLVALRHGTRSTHPRTPGTRPEAVCRSLTNESGASQ